MAITWSSDTLPATDTWQALAHNGSNLWVAARYNTTDAATSPDGDTWTARTLPITAAWTNMAYGAGLFVLWTASGNDDYVTSPDGISWTARTMPVNGNFRGCFGNSLFVVVDFATDDAYTSVNGTAWTARALPSTSNWCAVAWGQGAGVFCAISTSGTVAATSPDGTTWTARTLSTSKSWQSIAWSDSLGLFAVVGYASNVAMTSPDGINWTNRSLPATLDLAHVMWDGTQFVAFTDYDVDPNAVVTSPDGVNWSFDTDLPGTTTGVYASAVDGAGKVRVLPYDGNLVYGYDVVLSILGDASDSVAAATSSSADVWPSIADALNATDALTPDVLANLIERLSMTGSLSLNSTLAGSAADAVAFNDQVQAAWQLLLAEEIATVGDAVAQVRKVQAIVDALVATGQASGQNTALAACVAAIAMEGLLNLGFSADAVDAVTLEGQVAAIARMFAPALDSVIASDSGTPTLRVSAIGSESIGVAEDLSALLRANADINDGLLVYLTLSVDNDEYSGWVMNTGLKAVSTYTNVPFDSLCAFAGMHFGAGRNGLVQFTGTSDDGGPINLSIRSFLTDFGAGVFKRCPDAWIGVTNAGDVVLKVITREPVTGTACIDYYRAERGPAANEGKARVQIGRGLKSTWWGFELVNVDGASLDLNGIEMRPILLDRRT